jgi:tRNA uridine 5-carboxymethylaminomethyl modification enzyme
MQTSEFDIIVIGGGHAGAEAAWAGANLGASVALVTMDASRVGVMSCNPAIGGLAKGQMVREIDALGGLMGLATDATGIQFRMLNSSKGSAVWGPRAQCDKHRYAREVQRLLSTRSQITTVQGAAEKLLIEDGKIRGVTVLDHTNPHAQLQTLHARAVVLTTGTFMRGLMHTGESQTAGGRVGEHAAIGISAALTELGFDLGRLKTGTPPRLAAESIDFASLDVQPGDERPTPFSDMTRLDRFPVQEQRPCWITHTCEASHELIRANIHRAPMYNGQIQTQGPRYCPSIEDKVVRFADRSSHHVYLEPESLETNEIYCNGISTSLPADVQDIVVRNLPGCERAVILRHGYAVEYDMVWPHQIDATAMTKLVEGLFLAGQINGTSGYEEAAGQGLIAGLNAVRFTRGQSLLRLRRDQSYIGVLMDDLVTKTPREPYRMFTSRAEHRLMLRSDNADERLTPLGREWGLVDDARWQGFEQRRVAKAQIKQQLIDGRQGDQRLVDLARRPETTAQDVARWFGRDANHDEHSDNPHDDRLIATVLADIQYAGYVERQQRDVQRLERQEDRAFPVGFDFALVAGLRNEARNVLTKFRPATLGQAGRLAGVTPADVMLLSVTLTK